MHESPSMCYQCYKTTGKCTQNPVTLHPWESLENLNQFQCIPHNIFTTFNSFYEFGKFTSLFPQKPMAMQFPPQSQKRKVWQPKGELIRLSDVISQEQRNDKIDLSSSTKLHFLVSQPPNYLKVQASALGKNLCFVSVKPSVVHAEASWPVLDSWYYSLQIKPNKH